jgi:hypothetical protein
MSEQQAQRPKLRIRDLLVTISVVAVSLVAIFFCVFLVDFDHLPFWPKSPLQKISALKTNMRHLQLAAEDYKDKKGEYPQLIDSTFERQWILGNGTPVARDDVHGNDTLIHNPMTADSRWVVVIPIARKEEALEAANACVDGQVVYLPIIEGGKAKGYCIIGVGRECGVGREARFVRASGRVLILTEYGPGDKENNGYR